jgi:hypothetical protein
VTNGAIASAQLAANSVATGNIQDNAVTAGKIASGQVVKSLNGLTDGVSLTQGANVTINTVGNSLEISAPAGGLNLPFSGSASSSGSIFTLSNSAAGAAAAFLGRVGVGTAAPATPLHVRGTSEGLRIDGQANGGANQAFVSFRHLNGTSSGYVGDGSGEDHIYLAADTGDVALLTSIGRVLTAKSNGRVGIGTTTPQSTLDVRGDIRFGPVAQFRAVGAPEDLRIVRGAVDSSGNILAGTGFDVLRLNTGIYRITFPTPFSDLPTVTATVDKQSYSAVEPVTAMSNGPGTAGQQIVYIQFSGGTSRDADFRFIAVGPR